MELQKAIEERRSIRKFKSDEVSYDLIEKILNNVVLAPSAKNRQPWRIVILQGEKKDRVSDIMLDWREKNNGKMSMKVTAEVMKQAPVLLLVYKDGEEEDKDHDMISIGGAIEHICLTATDLGLGSLWIGYVSYIQKEINKYLNINNLELVSAISIGYSDEYPNKRPRKELKDILL